MHCYLRFTVMALQKYMNKFSRPISFHKMLPSIVLGMLFIGSILCLWPGVMSLDASGQYVAAKNGTYSDHHPPLMSFLWRYLDYIYSGPAPMFMFHLIMLYATAAIFLYIFRRSTFKWWYAIYAVLPNIVAYTALIVKDTGFTFCYLLAAALITLLSVNNVQRYRSLVLAIVCALLFYGTAVKFQAKFLLIFFTIGVSYCAFNYQLHRKAIIGGVVLFVAIMWGITTVDAKLVPTAKQAHSWQFVKVYDLSAISIALNEPLYPEFILRQPNFSFEAVKQKFITREIDPLVFVSNATIRKGDTAEQRQQLWDYWFKTVKQHPWLYIYSRIKLFSYNLITAPSDRTNPVNFLSNTALAPMLNLPGVSVAIDSAYTVCKFLLSFMWVLPLVFVYIYLGFKHLRSTRYAAPLLLCSMASLALMLVLLFFSMAATARYVFFCTCSMHLAHGLAYMTWQSAVTRKIENTKLENVQDLRPHGLGPVYRP